MSKASEYMKKWRAENPDRAREMRERAKAKAANGGVAQPVERVCKHCGKAFSTTNLKQVFCTKECQKECANARDREARRQEPRKCAFCGKIFQPSRSSHICCSRSCSNGLHNRIRNEKRHLSFKPIVYSKVCPCCGKTFETTTFLRKACSDECAKAIMRKQNKAAYSARKDAHPPVATATTPQASHRILRDSYGLTATERNAVIRAQNGPREELWRASRDWTPAQRKFAKRRYEAMHPFNHANAGWY